MNPRFDDATEFLSGEECTKTIENLPHEIHNKITGDRLRIIHSAADGFDSVRIEFSLPPSAKGAPLHYHLSFEETFEVVSGRLEMVVGTVFARRVVTPGEIVTVGKGTLHSFQNPFNAPVTFVSQATPAVDFEKFIRVLYGLANDGRTKGEGMPNNFLQLAMILDLADLYFPMVPAPVQKIVRKTLAAVARSVGADRELQKYIS